MNTINRLIELPPRQLKCTTKATNSSLVKYTLGSSWPEKLSYTGPVIETESNLDRGLRILVDLHIC